MVSDGARTSVRQREHLRPGSVERGRGPAEISERANVNAVLKGLVDVVDVRWSGERQLDTRPRIYSDTYAIPRISPVVLVAASRPAGKIFGGSPQWVVG